jgi:hypothetical protein
MSQKMCETCIFGRNATIYILCTNTLNYLDEMTAGKNHVTRGGIPHSSSYTCSRWSQDKIELIAFIPGGDKNNG